MNTEIEVGPGVLVPRAETEHLGRTALELIALKAEPVVVDMCCGSGNVGLGMLAHRPDIRLYGADLGNKTFRKHWGWTLSRLELRGLLSPEEQGAARAAHLSTKDNAKVTAGIRRVYDALLDERAVA